MVKVKLTLEHAMKAQTGSTGIAHLFIIDARWRVGVQRTPLPLYPRERTGTHCIGG